MWQLIVDPSFRRIRAELIPHPPLMRVSHPCIISPTHYACIRDKVNFRRGASVTKNRGTLGPPRSHSSADRADRSNFEQRHTRAPHPKQSNPTLTHTFRGWTETNEIVWRTNLVDERLSTTMEQLQRGNRNLKFGLQSLSPPPSFVLLEVRG